MTSSFRGCIAAIALALAAVGVYGLVGALIHWRALPSIVVTLGMSFVWGGLAVLLLPAPGGLSSVVRSHSPMLALTPPRN